MGSKYKTKKNELPKMIKNAEALNGKRVNVGCDWANAWLAGIHEYGCRIKVTPKMRAYLHGQGLHLKESTTEIVIPERSFLRAGWDANYSEVKKKTDSLLPAVISGKMLPHAFCETLGLLLSTKIRTYARDLNSPGNHPFTADRKGSSNPLVDTGAMIGSIDYEVEG